MKNSVLLLKSVAGMLFLWAVMSVCIFLPPKSLAYSLGWWYLIAFFLPVLVITIYIYIFDKKLLESRLPAGPAAEKRVFQKIFQTFAGLLFIGIYLFSSFDYANRWSDVPFWLSYLASATVFLSMMMVFFVFKQNSFLSATVEVQQDQKVISTGLYGIVRHPMYAFVSIMLLFTPLALGSYYGVILSVLLFVLIYARAIDEEKDLKQNLAGYKKYCKKVKYRIIPFVL